MGLAVLLSGGGQVGCRWEGEGRRRRGPDAVGSSRFRVPTQASDAKNPLSRLELSRVMLSTASIQGCILDMLVPAGLAVAENGVGE